MISGKNYIGNKLSSEGDITFKTFNPLTNTENEIIFTEASDQEIEEIIIQTRTGSKTEYVNKFEELFISRDFPCLRYTISH